MAPSRKILKQFLKEVSFLIPGEGRDFIRDNYPFDYFDGYRDQAGNIDLVQWLLSAIVKYEILEKLGVRDSFEAEARGKFDHIPEEDRHREKDSEWWKHQTLERARCLISELKRDNKKLAEDVKKTELQIKRKFRIISEPEYGEELIKVAALTRSGKKGLDEQTEGPDTWKPGKGWQIFPSLRNLAESEDGLNNRMTAANIMYHLKAGKEIYLDNIKSFGGNWYLRSLGKAKLIGSLQSEKQRAKRRGIKKK